MHIVHRDISPQNILVGSDGVPRIVDFGVAKAAQRLQTTADGQVKGKIAYMAPEQIRQARVSRQTDIYAMGVVLWEVVAGKRLFTSENHANLMSKVISGAEHPPSKFRSDSSPALDALVMRALSAEPKRRFETAREMAAELQKLLPPAPPTDVGDWVNHLARDSLTHRRLVVKRVESRELPKEGATAEQFVARPSNEDLLTVLERPGPLDDDSTQAVTTGKTRGRSENSRLLIPLFLGLALVLGVIVTLIVQSRPRLEDSPESVGSPSKTTAESTPPSGAGTTPSAGAIRAPDSKTGAGSPPHKDSAETAESAEDSEKRPEEERTSSEPEPPPCPKFIVDAEGIRRINRKCWK